MRTSDERVDELHRRMASMKQLRSSRRYLLSCAAACVLFLVLALGFTYRVASLSARTPEAEGAMLTASIFADHRSLGYVVAAVVSFCLGAVFTMFCFRMRKQTEEKNQTTDKKQ